MLSAAQGFVNEMRLGFRSIPIGRRIRAWSEIAFTVAFLLALSGGILDYALSALSGPVRDAFQQMIWLPLYAVTCLLLISNTQRVAEHIAAFWPMGVVLLLAPLSVLWSVDPMLSFKKSIALLGSGLFAFYLYARYQLTSWLRLLAIVCAIAAVGSLLVVLIQPTRGIMQEEIIGAWCGLWQHKNSLGGHMAIASIVAVMGALMDHRRWRWAYLALLALAIFLMIMSRSTTSLLITLIATGGGVGVWLLQNRLKLGLVLLYSLCVLVAVVIFGYLFLLDLLFKILGKDESFTGRIPIWQAILYALQGHELLGYGYAAFWTGADGPSWFVLKVLKWDVPSAHQGWLDIALQTGWLGAGCMALSYMATVARGLILLRRSARLVFAVPLLGAILVYSLSESILMLHNSLTWTLVLLASAYVWEDPINPIRSA